MALNGFESSLSALEFLTIDFGAELGDFSHFPTFYVKEQPPVYHRIGKAIVRHYRKKFKNFDLRF
jgi:hypothetical protein